MSSEQEAREAAEEFREKLGLGLAPIDDLDLLFDSFNVDVITVAASRNKCASISHALNSYRPHLHKHLIPNLQPRKQP